MEPQVLKDKQVPLALPVLLALREILVPQEKQAQQVQQAMAEPRDHKVLRALPAHKDHPAPLAHKEILELPVHKVLLEYKD